ncbi:MULTISPECIES: SRPBCC family protein [unclassified Pseudomonas]|uniref:SRPBCC family protein n=1 Tax=unclassified Pseudomonas TaxID=196821 RepID=UPI000D3DA30C|nr:MULTISPECIES: SRPBCC family protein [unclassified Pseudomonas]RAU47895.1 carbon monoxide dehydrogenase [Pseudomonas sp. RIT 409]RAU55411.1 carbon monoxide dehydrogenase [Pseudomonas sp. RIT 412]
MDIEQSFSVPFAPDLVWKSFLDVEGIVTCLPGASLTEPPQDDQLSLAMTVKLGPIVAAFKGQGDISLDAASHSGVVSGQGSDRKSGSRVKGTAQFELLPDGAGGTRVNVGVTYSITGSLAQFSRGGIVRELATRMTEAFAENLKTRLEAANDHTVAVEPVDHAASSALPEVNEARVAEPSAVTASEAVGRQPAEPQAPLDLGNMFWTLLLRRLRRLFGLKEKRRCPTCGK